VDKVVHFEIPVDDTSRASDFYGSLFGWQIVGVPDLNYTLVSTVEADEKGTPTEPGAINGGMMERSEKIKTPVITISVDDIDEKLSQIKQKASEVVVDKMGVGNMGFAAYFKDSEGNTLGLWQTAASA